MEGSNGLVQNVDLWTQVLELLDELGPGSLVAAYTLTHWECHARSANAVRTQCEVLNVGQYSDPTFGPF